MAYALAEELGLEIEFVPVPRERLAEVINSGLCDVIMGGIAVTTRRAGEMVFSPPYVDETLSFVVPDHRRAEFSSAEWVRATPGLRVAVPNLPYLEEIVHREFPRMEIVPISVDRVADFFAGRSEQVDGLVFPAERGSYFTLLYPAFTVAVPHPLAIRFPLAYPVARRDLEFARFLGIWIDLQRKNGTIQALYDHWILGRDARPKQPHWSVIRNVLHWVELRISHARVWYPNYRERLERLWKGDSAEASIRARIGNVMTGHSLLKTYLSKLPFWSIPMIYAAVTVAAGLVFPRLEFHYLAGYRHGMTVSIATAVFSSIASGMLALTGIVFSLAFVMVQFSSIAYSPRLVLWFSRDPVISHAMGMFTATFIYSLSALGWVDRNGEGGVPFFSTWIVILLVIASVMALALLVQRLAALQVSGVIAFVGGRGREVIGEMYPVIVATEGDEETGEKAPNSPPLNLPVTQVVLHSGAPMAISEYNLQALVELAQQAGGVIVMPLAVGDTAVEGDAILAVHGGHQALPPAVLRQAVHLESQRTFDQDPKYAIRLLVDIAIKALSPAVNDPTTAVQALDEIEDLLRRIGTRHLEVGQVTDERGGLRLVFPAPTWEDFLSLAFDEIRFYGATSLQVMRRLRTALYDLERIAPPARQKALRHYIDRLDFTVKHSISDTEDQTTALQQDRQGLGLSRR